MRKDLTILSIDEKKETGQAAPAAAEEMPVGVTNHAAVAPARENGVDYQAVVRTFFQLENPQFPHVIEGCRNDTVFNTVAKYIRYVADHDEARVKELIWPDFCFGLPEREVDGIIHSAVGRERSLTPKIVKQVLSQHQAACSGRSYDLIVHQNAKAPYLSMEQCVVNDSLIPRLPRWLDVALRTVPVGYKFPVLMAMEPALMTLATGVSCKLSNKPASRLNAWTHLDGAPASNKSLMVAPIRAVLKPLQEQDDYYQQMENDYLAKLESAKNKDEQPNKPKIPIRILPANTTRVEHIERMMDCEGKHTYTLAEELSSLSLTSNSQYMNREDFMRYQFDNGMVGNRSKSTATCNGSVPVAWNLTTSGTRDQTMACWRNPTNGSAHRVMFVLMPDNTYAEWPDYSEYTEWEKAYLARAGRILMRMHGTILTPRLSKTVRDWSEEKRMECQKTGNVTRDQFRKRSIDICFRYAFTLHLAWIVQQILDEEDAKGIELNVEELDLQDYKEKTSTGWFACYVGEYCLDVQYHLWARKMEAKLEQAYQGLSEVKTTAMNRLDTMPKEFTSKEVTEVFGLSKVAALRMLARWKEQGFVRVKSVMEDRTKLYEKAA